MSWSVAGLCLLHFLWQGTLLGGVAWVFLSALRDAGAQARYLVGCLVLLLMACCPLLTAWTLSGQALHIDASNSLALDFRLVVLPWLVGVVFLTIRLLGGFGGYVMLSRAGLTSAPQDLQERFDALVRVLGLRIEPRLYLSSRVSVPTAIGFLKGVVLLPMSVACGVPPKMLDALLLHELAHVSRFDFLANAIQCVVEVVLFYHPAVWWLSKRIRQERENCCDDMVVNSIQDRKTYVKALAAAAELMPQQLVLRSDGGDLLARIHRILGKPQAGPRTSPVLVSVLLAIFIVTPILAGFRTPVPSTNWIIVESVGDKGETKVYNVPLGDGSKVKTGGPGDPVVIDAVLPVEAVDRETALKNGWITPDQ